jgi:hypothetical protein
LTSLASPMIAWPLMKSVISINVADNHEVRVQSSTCARTLVTVKHL